MTGSARVVFDGTSVVVVDGNSVEDDTMFVAVVAVVDVVDMVETVEVGVLKFPAINGENNSEVELNVDSLEEVELSVDSLEVDTPFAAIVEVDKPSVLSVALANLTTVVKFSLTVGLGVIEDITGFE